MSQLLVRKFDPSECLHHLDCGDLKTNARMQVVAARATIKAITGRDPYTAFTAEQLVAVKNSEICGFISMSDVTFSVDGEEPSRELFITTLAVDQHHQGGRVAKRLLEKMLQQIDSSELPGFYRFVIVYVERVGHYSNLLEAHGFQATRWPQLFIRPCSS